MAQQRQMQTSHPDRPISSIEKTDVGPKSSRQGIEVLMNSAFREPSRSRTVSPPPAPRATDVYLAQAKLPSVQRDAPQRLLLVLDLNGTLIARKAKHLPASFDRRPGIDKFFDYIFANHSVMIYTSSQPRTVQIVLPKLFTEKQRKQLVGVWDRTKLDLTPRQYSEKVQVYKRLEKIWASPDIQATYPKKLGVWNQMNTILIDDSELKALAQPHNLLQVPEFLKHAPQKDRWREKQILDSVILRLEQLKYHTDVSRLIRLWQIGKVEPPKAHLLEEEGSSATSEPSDDEDLLRATRAMSVG